MRRRIQLTGLARLTTSRTRRDQRGATAVEYALMMAFIAAVIAASAAALGIGVNSMLLSGLAGFP